MEQGNKRLSAEEKSRELEEKICCKLMDGLDIADDMLPEERREQLEQKRNERNQDLTREMLGNKGGIYDLGDIFNEVWNDTIKVDGEDISFDIANMKPDDDSANRKKLNSMFEALFGCRYENVLIRRGKPYIVGEAGKAFLKLLLKSYSTSNGKKIRKPLCKDVDFQYENYLICLAMMFLDEQEELDAEKKNVYEELRSAIMENFSIDEGEMELKKSLLLFNKMIEEVSKDDVLAPMKEWMAFAIDRAASVIINDIPINFP